MPELLHLISLNTAINTLGNNMQTVKVNREKLLNVVKDNRVAHIKEYEDTYAGWQEDCVEAPEKRLERAKTGDINMSFSLPEPEYVMDDWGWKAGFMRMSQTYNKAGL